ncbi:MAG: 50S ribosomal protein L23 [Pedobacter sp.]|nr:MAG: 50S ribosomal protein L23 [Pedobacter sp.]
MANLEKQTSRSLSELLSLFKAPVITEKSVSLAQIKQYTFLVDRRLTKNEIQRVIEKVFNVQVECVRTLILPTKIKRFKKSKGRISQYKKAYVKLKANYEITNVFD